MRSAGTVQVAASRSTSSHRAPRTSPERAAVSATNSRASRVDGHAWLSRMVASAAPTSPCARARPVNAILRERRPHGLDRSVGPMSIGHGPPEHRADALKHPPPRRLALVVPNRPHHREHVMRGNVGYRLAHQRHRVGVEARPPLFFRLAAVAPVGPLQREHRFDALGEGGGGRAGRPGVPWGRRPAVPACDSPGRSSEPRRAWSIARTRSQYPVAVAVAMSPRRSGLNEARRQSGHVSLPKFLPNGGTIPPDTNKRFKALKRKAIEMMVDYGI